MTGSGAEKPFVRLARVMFAAGVVLGSAAVGYWSSLIWPLTSSGSESGVGAQVAGISPASPPTGPSNSAEGVTASQVASEVKVRPFQPVIAIPPLAAEVRNPADPAVVVKASLTAHPGDATPATSQTAKIGNPAEAGETAASDSERTEAAPTRSAKANRRTVRIERRARTTSGAPKLAQSAAPSGGNYERVPILKQFMTSTNKY